MKILFLLQDLPFPPSTGINSKAYNVIRYLAAKGWECDVLCFASGEVSARVRAFEKAVPDVRVLGVYPGPSGIMLILNKAFNFIKGLPPSLAEFYSVDFIKALKAASSATKYDVVHYDVINIAQYLPWGPALPSVLSSNDAISLSYERMIKENHGLLRKIYLSAASLLIKRFEKNHYPGFSAVHVVSSDDAAYLKRISPGTKLKIIPIAMDGSFVNYQPGPETCHKVPRVVFTGNLNIPGIANGLFEFLEEVYGDAAAGVPPFELYVLGPKASERDIKRLSLFKGLQYFGWVEDYKAFLAAADVVLILDRSGTGIKTRVLNAMALGKPVIGTTVAFGGISAENGKHCFIRNAPVEIRAALKTLLADKELRENMGRAARGFIFSAYTMEVVGPQWEDLYKDVS
ncbi:MAG: glycosyltransferase family 4 protein [Elusimicrobia bacterium]|nr:glycosyltransferase family 4 protein [Elusimicrobiota bacterium]